MPTLYSLVVVTAILLSFTVSTQGQSVSNAEIATGSNAFGYSVASELYTDSSSNIWISPFCITSCFSLIYPGSGGNTQTQIAEVMGYPTTTTDAGDITQQFFSLQGSIENTYDGVRENDYDAKPSIIGIANKIYASNTISLKQTYIDALYDSIRTESFIETDFDFSASDAATIINQWVSDNTNGLIDGVLDENGDYSDWKLAALNAIYLNASFQEPFDSTMTSLQKFYTDSTRSSESSDIHLMHQMGWFPYWSDGNYQFLKFSFTDSADLFALFALPINHRLYEEKNALITDLDYVQTAVSNLQSTYMALALPKLSISERYTLNTPLQEMGITDAFDASLADFTGIAEGANLMIDSVVHKTMIEMDEEGLLAAAVTVIGMVLTSIRIPPKETLFKADHPFQMFIIDGANENTILFMGQINNPGIPQGSQTPTYDESVDPRWSNFTLYGDRNVNSSATTSTTGGGEDLEEDKTTTDAVELPGGAGANHVYAAMMICGFLWMLRV